MNVAALIGSPVAHSLSPAIHNAAFAAAGRDWVYVAFDVAPGRAGAALEAMRTLGLAGLSVTTPHKEQAASAVDSLAESAESLRSVNTVVPEPDGQLVGHSTDGDGFVDSLMAAGVDPGGLRVAVIGAGAAARSVIDALARSGAADVAVVNRTPSRGTAAAAVALTGRVGTLDDVAGAELVVNATSVGMETSEIPVPADLLRAHQVVADLVYQPLRTALLRAAGEKGCITVDGLGMLVHQAVRQQLLWTGERPDPAVMRAVAEEELERRR
ncbi:MAG: shikimate dehydrogenase [Acidimicrobiia bacterium]|nr:shikimate dehydrogenase [Acidimicrobiia bacterium]MDQ3390162.1 shikimate dehydrogenase [Actinomycetota bacterium]